MKRGGFLFLAAVFATSCGGRSENDVQHGSGGAGTGGSDAGLGGHSGLGGTGNTTTIDSGVTDVTVADVGPPPPGQNVLFEVSYENYAWAPALKGVFITVDGAVYSYDYFETDDGGYGPTVIFPATEAELEARYGPNPKQTGTVPVNELMAKFALVQSAASGVLLGDDSCADAGEHSFLGYLYDAGTARYTRVILGMNGDHAAKNTSPVANELVTWLTQFGGSGSGCEFNGAQCMGAICTAPQPTCPQGQVASVEDGCWGKCVTANRCLEVSDCSVCGGIGVACAISGTGSHHCIQLYCQNADLCACSFAPPCAGGAEHCQMSGSFEATCAP